MKNLIFVIPTLRIAGAEKSLINLLKSLDPEEVNVDLLVFEADGPLQAEVPDWVNIINSDFLTRGMLLELRYYFWDLLKHLQIRAAILRAWISLRSKLGFAKKFYWTALKKYIKPQNKRYDIAIGYLEDIADYYVIDKIKANRKIGWIHVDFSGMALLEEEKVYYEKFDCLVTISQKCKEAFKKAMGNDSLKIEVIENIVLSDEIIKKADKQKETNWDICKYNIVTVGRLEYQKGIDIGARACKKLCERGYPIAWHVYGTGSMKKEIEQYIEENDLQGRFILEGTAANPYPYIKMAKIVVQPSRWEGKSVALDEAKILGKAIVTTDYPSVADQIVDGKSGLVVECNPEALAEGIIRLIQEEPLKERIETYNRENINRNSLEPVRLFKRLIGV